MEFAQEYILISNTPFGALQVRYYGIIIVAAMLVAATIAARLAQRDGRDPDHIWGALTWAIIPGIIGARLWFILFPPISLTAGCATGGVCQDTAWFFQNFFNVQTGAIAIWSGGIHIFGAFIGGLLGTYLYFSRYHNPIANVIGTIFLPLNVVLNFIAWVPVAIYQRIRSEEITPFKIERPNSDFAADGMPILPWLDIAAVALPLGQAVGRWANFINQELYGTPTTLPWGITIETSKRVGEYASPVDYPASTLFHPLFLYEALWSLVAFFVMLNLYQRNRRQFNTGDFLLIYLAQYAFVRFLLEFLRVEKAFIPGTDINSAQVVTAVVFVVAVVLFFYRRASAKPQAAAA